MQTVASGSNRFFAPETASAVSNEQTVASGTDSVVDPAVTETAAPNNVTKPASKPVGIRLPWRGFGRRKLLRA
jgi:hypothetical protein